MSGTCQLVKIAPLLCGFLCVSPLNVRGDTVSVKVKIEIQAAPCVINRNNPIVVDFQEVLTTRVDGVNYRKTIPYTIACSTSGNNALKLRIEGTGAGFNSAVLQTSVSTLGIRLQHDSTMLELNEWLNFNYSGNTPALWAVPVMQTGATLPSGIFTASSVMKVSYQ